MFIAYNSHKNYPLSRRNSYIYMKIQKTKQKTESKRVAQVYYDAHGRRVVLGKQMKTERAMPTEKPEKSLKPKRGELQALHTMKVHGEVPLLEFLFSRLTDMPKSTVKHYLTNKQVLVNGSCITQYNFTLYKEDVVVIAKYAQRDAKKPLEKPDIIYEDNEIIVINKPSGLLSVESDTERNKTAYRQVEQYVRAKDKTARVVIVHRIDRDTSGVLLFAKNEYVKETLFKHWNDIVTKREYIAVCEGKFSEKQGTVKSYLMQNVNNVVYSSHDAKNGQLAVTHYKVLKECRGYSLVDVNIDTGRKNQIRVHMKDLGHQVVGDNKYGNVSDPLGRLGLHAYKLEFTHPITKKQMKFTAKMPVEFSKMFK